MHTPTQLLFAARLSCAYLKGEETSSRGTVSGSHLVDWGRQVWGRWGVPFEKD